MGLYGALNKDFLCTIAYTCLGHDKIIGPSWFEIYGTLNSPRISLNDLLIRQQGNTENSNLLANIAFSKFQNSVFFELKPQKFLSRNRWLSKAMNSYLRIASEIMIQEYVYTSVRAINLTFLRQTFTVTRSSVSAL